MKPYNFPRPLFIISGILIICTLTATIFREISKNNTKAIIAELEAPDVVNGTPYYAEIGQHNEDASIIVDFSLPSSGHRFFVYDNREKRVISASKCAHGSGGGSTVSRPEFSNQPGSECSCLGVFLLTGNDRLHNYNLPCIRIKGLSATNSNAHARGIVIHEGPIMADDITLGIAIPVTPLISQGCFTISSKTFRLLQSLMEQRKTVYLYAICP